MDYMFLSLARGRTYAASYLTTGSGRKSFRLRPVALRAIRCQVHPWASIKLCFTPTLVNSRRKVHESAQQLKLNRTCAFPEASFHRDHRSALFFFLNPFPCALRYRTLCSTSRKYVRESLPFLPPLLPSLPFCSRSAHYLESMRWISSRRKVPHVRFVQFKTIRLGYRKQKLTTRLRLK